MSTDNKVSVAIIGGGVAGLTLANILEQSDISYVLWEAHNQIAPPAGASVGLMPNGLRILDQIGVIDDTEKYMVSHDSWQHRDGDGTLYCTLTAMRRYPELFGYGAFFMERQRLLEILYENIRDKTRIHTGQRAASVQSFDTHAIVTGANGTQLRCDFVVGADGVHSVVRREIHAAMPELEIPADYLETRYTCVYGISNPLPQITAGRNFTIYQAGASLLLFAGAGGTLYWFIFSELKETIPYYGGGGSQAAATTAPRAYGPADIHAAFAKVAGVPIITTTTTTETAVTFADVFRARRTTVMTPLEEGVAPGWTAGRMVLMGDAAHKMVPHAAMGANQAMESAACFASRLLELCAQRQQQQQQQQFDGGSLPPHIAYPLVEECLREYVRRRRARVTGIVEAAGFACRAQLKVGDGVREYLAGLPALRDEDWLGRVVDSLLQGEKIEGLDGDGHRVRSYSNRAQNRNGARLMTAAN